MVDAETRVVKLVIGGAIPTAGAVRLEVVAATIDCRLGIDPRTRLRDSLNRPHTLASGSLIREIVA